MTLVLATRNAGKLAEMQARLEGTGIVLLSAGAVDGPDVVEDAPSLQGNALLKARALHAHAGLPALADDTGLEVDALGGAPGVHSARYAGPESDDKANRSRLLAELRSAGDAGRRARFRTVLAFVDDDGERLFEGACDGEITDEERGAGGFGYDSLFVPDDQPAGAGRRTFAEMTKEEKNRISHRGRAVDAFVEWIVNG